MKFSNGMITFGSSYLGWGIQLYWPEMSIEWEPKSASDRTKAYPHGFCLKFGTTVRLVIGRADKHYALAGKILGFGIGIQYCGKE